MKKFAIFLLVLLLLIGGGVFALTRYFSMDEIQRRVVEQVKDKTGRDLAFSSMRFGFFPNLGLRLRDVTLSNPAWAKDKSMISLGEMNLGLALKPLFNKQIEVTHFTLNKPVITLEVGADGRKSWEFEGLKQKADPAGTKQGAPEAKMDGDLGFKFSQIDIRGGSLSFVDLQKGTNVAVDGIDITINYPDLSSPLQVDGTFHYNKKRLNFFAALDKPLDFINGKQTPGKLNLSETKPIDLGTASSAGNGDFNLMFDGALSTGGTLLAGKVNANIVSLPETLAWIQGGAPQDLPFKTISFTSQTEVSAANVLLKGAALKLDDIEAKGDVGLGLSGKPSLKARLNLSKLDLDRFVKGKGDESADKAAAPRKAPDAGGWNASPMDFSGLKALNADVVLQTQGFSLRGAEVGPSTLTAQLQDGNLQAKSSEATLFGGKFSSALTINAAPAVPTEAFKFTMAGVQAKPVLTTFADFTKLDGTADATVDVMSSGNSQKAIIGALAGSGTAAFRNGSLQGIDFVNVAKMIQSRLGEMGVGEGKTDFVALTGSFTISNGVAHNADLKMQGPLVQATGSGDINLPQKRVDYRVLPVLTASSAVEGAKGITVPVNINGPFSAIKVKPDYKAAVQGILDNPEDAKAAVKNVRDQGKVLLKDIKKDPKGALNNLFGGGGLFGRKQAAPADEPAIAPATIVPAPAPATAPAASPAGGDPAAPATTTP